MARERLDPKDPSTWYSPADADIDVGSGLTVADLAERIYDKRKDVVPETYESQVCKEFGVTDRTVKWTQMGPAIQQNIFEFCYWMRFNPMPQQKKVLQAVQDGHLFVAVKSGQGPGKTTVSAIIGLWWQLQNRDVRNIVTAPSMHQCRDVWLSEVRERMRFAHPLLKKFITVTSSRVYFGGFANGGPIHKNWRCELLTASDSSAFQGQHNKRLTAIVEEACGVKADIIEALKGTVSNVGNAFQEDAEEGSILMIGNPTVRDSEFFKCFNKMGTHWTQITMDAEESPIVNPSKLIQHAIEFGVDSDFYRTRVQGEFPATDAAGIINPDDVYAAVGCAVDVALANPRLIGQRQFGIDLARQGGDETVVYRRSGGCIVEWRKWPKTAGFEPAHAIRWAFKQQVEAEWHNHQTLYTFDAGGIGQGVYHLFDDHGKECFPFHTQAKSARPTVYANRMTEAWFFLARLLKERKVRIPDDPILHQQLITRRYGFTKEGLIIVEPKPIFMKRTKESSPDRADALVMAFYSAGYTDSKVARK